MPPVVNTYGGKKKKRGLLKYIQREEATSHDLFDALKIENIKVTKALVEEKKKSKVKKTSSKFLNAKPINSFTSSANFEFDRLLNEESFYAFSSPEVCSKPEKASYVLKKRNCGVSTPEECKLKELKNGKRDAIRRGGKTSKKSPEKENKGVAGKKVKKGKWWNFKDDSYFQKTISDSEDEHEKSIRKCRKGVPLNGQNRTIQRRVLPKRCGIKKPISPIYPVGRTSTPFRNKKQFEAVLSPIGTDLYDSINRRDCSSKKCDVSVDMFSSYEREVINKHCDMSSFVKSCNLPEDASSVVDVTGIVCNETTHPDIMFCPQGSPVSPCQTSCFTKTEYITGSLDSYEVDEKNSSSQASSHLSECKPTLKSVAKEAPFEQNDFSNADSSVISSLKPQHMLKLSCASDESTGSAAIQLNFEESKVYDNSYTVDITGDTHQYIEECEKSRESSLPWKGNVPVCSSSLLNCHVILTKCDERDSASQTLNSDMLSECSISFKSDRYDIDEKVCKLFDTDEKVHKLFETTEPDSSQARSCNYSNCEGDAEMTDSWTTNEGREISGHRSGALTDDSCSSCESNSNTTDTVDLLDNCSPLSAKDCTDVSKLASGITQLHVTTSISHDTCVEKSHPDCDFEDGLIEDSIEEQRVLLQKCDLKQLNVNSEYQYLTDCSTSRIAVPVNTLLDSQVILRRCDSNHQVILKDNLTQNECEASIESVACDLRPSINNEAIVLMPGKQWRRSLSILSRVRTSDGARKSIVDARGKGKCWQSTVNSIIEMQPQNVLLEESDESSLLNLDNSVEVCHELTTAADFIPRSSSFNSCGGDEILKRCGQSSPLPFEHFYPQSMKKKCCKIGEGVYGEVFLLSGSAKRPASVIKIIPIEGKDEVNGEPQKTFQEILSEVCVAQELSNLRKNKTNAAYTFNEVQAIRCIQGRYPEWLLELWCDFNDKKGSENDSPEMFREDQLYITLELSHGGIDLESFVFGSADQGLAAFKQIAITLAIGEKSLCFEHRDLHWGNVLVSKTKDKEVSFTLDGNSIQIPSKGIQISIIDFTMSRITDPITGCPVYYDLSKDETLFTAQGDYQFEVYRIMKNYCGNHWDDFSPKTNVAWLHYLADKLCTMARYRNRTSREHFKALDILSKMKDCLPEHTSAEHFVTDPLFTGLL